MQRMADRAPGLQAPQDPRPKPAAVAADSVAGPLRPPVLQALPSVPQAAAACCRPNAAQLRAGCCLLASKAELARRRRCPVGLGMESARRFSAEDRCNVLEPRTAAVAAAIQSALAPGGRYGPTGHVCRSLRWKWSALLHFGRTSLILDQCRQVCCTN